MIVAKHRAVFFVVTFVCLFVTGCGDSGMPMTKVSGKVTFNGGPPPRAGRIAFSLVPGTGREGLPYRPGAATFDTSGEFKVTTLEDGDGLLPGTYEVRIICITGLPGQTASYESVSLTPANWKPENVVITGDDRSLTVNFDVPPKKPS